MALETIFQYNAARGLLNLVQCGPRTLELSPMRPASLFEFETPGLVVRVKTHVQEVVSSNPGPAVETIFHAPLIWIKSMKAKIVVK